MLAFTGILIALLWILQTVYLEDFYKMVKMNEVDNAIDNVITVIDDEEIEEAITTISTNYDMSIALVEPNGIMTDSSGENSENYIGFISISKREQLFKKAKANDGEYTVRDFVETFEEMPVDMPENMWQNIPDELKNDGYGNKYKKPDNGYNSMPNMPMQIET